MDAVGRAMRACPFPCKDYTPAPEHLRPQQEVHVVGGEWHRSRTCPGSGLDDPVVVDLLEDDQALRNWCQGNSLEWWNQQPGWWTEGIRIVQSMRDTIRDELRQPAMGHGDE